MFPRLEYLEFADRWFGKARFDLATSGVRPIGADVLEPVDPTDFEAKARFRRAVAKRYDVDEAEVVPVLGASGGLFVAFSALLEPGGSALVETPGYEPLWRIPEALGARVDRFERSFDDDFQVDLDRISSSVRDDTRVVALTNPHNPTAAVVPAASMVELANALAERKVALLVDEAYAELWRPRTTTRRTSANVVTCSSTTKCLGVPWARAGWLLLPEALAPAAASVEKYLAGVAPPTAWGYGEQAITRADELLRRVESIQAGKRAQVDDFIGAHAGRLRWVTPPPSSVYGFVEVAHRADVTAAIERGIETHEVIVSPGEFFGTPGAFRMSWTTSTERLGPGLERLARVLDL